MINVCKIIKINIFLRIVNHAKTNQPNQKMRQLYGLIYQGSKNKIAEWVLDNTPHADNFYDLFGGGGAVTHAAIRSGKFRNFIFNDLNPLCQGFVKAANGEYSDERLQHFISREEYDRTRTTDEIAFFCYSFGGNGENYLYAKELEPFKAALHKARVFGDMSDLKAMGCPSASRKWIFEHLETVKHAYTDWYLSEVLKTDLTYGDYKGKLDTQIKQREEELREYLCDAFKQSGLKSKREVGIRLGTNMERHYFGRSQWEFPTAEAYAKMQTFMPLPRPYESLFGLEDGAAADVDIRSLISLEKLTSFYSLEHWQNIQRLRSLRGLCTQAMRGVCGKYNDVDIAPNSVVYCDIPYSSTAGYVTGDFDHAEFYKWAMRQKALVLISEYNMPEPDFVAVAQTKVVCTLSAYNNAKTATERLYVPRHQLAEYKRRIGLLF